MNKEVGLLLIEGASVASEDVTVKPSFSALTVVTQVFAIRKASSRDLFKKDIFIVIIYTPEHSIL
jgi:hypothetical protein